MSNTADFQACANNCDVFVEALRLIANTSVMDHDGSSRYLAEYCQAMAVKALSIAKLDQR